MYFWGKKRIEFPDLEHDIYFYIPVKQIIQSISHIPLLKTYIYENPNPKKE